MTKTKLPAPVFNRRITCQVREFYTSMEGVFRRQGWPVTPVEERPGFLFVHPHFRVSPKQHFSDGAIQVLRLKLSNVPGVSSVPTGPKPNMNWSHTLDVGMPRSYPMELHRLQIQCQSSLANPRLRKGGACLNVRGDLDRVLTDLVYHVLLEPSRIKPPKLYPGNDHGIDSRVMAWYQKQRDYPQRIHDWLLRRWAERIEELNQPNG